MKYFEWNEITTEIQEISETEMNEMNADDTWPVTKSTENWKEARSDRNHLSLTTEAESLEAAERKFATHPEWADWHEGEGTGRDEVTYDEQRDLIADLQNEIAEDNAKIRELKNAVREILDLMTEQSDDSAATRAAHQIANDAFERIS